MSNQCVLTPNRPSVGNGSPSRRVSADLVIMMAPAALVLVLVIAAIFFGSYLYYPNQFGIGTLFIREKNHFLFSASELSTFPQTVDRHVTMQFIQRQPLIIIGLACSPDSLFSCSTPTIRAKRIVNAARWRSPRSPPIQVMACRARAGQGRDVAPVWIQPCPR